MLLEPFAPPVLEAILDRLPGGNLPCTFADGFSIPSKDTFRQSLAAASERRNDFSHEFPPLSPFEDLGSIFPYRQNLYIAFFRDLPTAKF